MRKHIRIYSFPKQCDTKNKRRILLNEATKPSSRSAPADELHIKTECWWVVMCWKEEVPPWGEVGYARCGCTPSTSETSTKRETATRRSSIKHGRLNWCWQKVGSNYCIYCVNISTLGIPSSFLSLVRSAQHRLTLPGLYHDYICGPCLYLLTSSCWCKLCKR